MHKRKEREYGVFYIAEKKYMKIFKIFLILLLASFFFISARPARPQSASVFNAAVGFIYYYGGNYRYAIDAFNKEPAGLFKNSYADYILASLYFKNGEYRKSLNRINIALKLRNIGKRNKNTNKKLSKTDIKYLTLKAKITAAAGNLKESTGILKRILQRNPYELKALLFISNLYLYKKDLETAALYLKILKLNHPHNIASYYLLSKIYAARNQNGKAERNLLNAIKIDPYFKKAYFRLAAVYILAGKEKNAVRVFDKYLKINPYSKTAIYQSAIIEYALKNYKSSEKRFLNFIYITKNSKNMSRLRNNAYFFIGISYILRKDNEKGLFYLNMLVPGRHYIDAKLQEMEIYINLYKKNWKY